MESSRKQMIMDVIYKRTDRTEAIKTKFKDYSDKLDTELRVQTLIFTCEKEKNDKIIKQVSDFYLDIINNLTDELAKIVKEVDDTKNPTPDMIARWMVKKDTLKEKLTSFVIENDKILEEYKTKNEQLFTVFQKKLDNHKTTVDKLSDAFIQSRILNKIELLIDGEETKTLSIQQIKDKLNGFKPTELDPVIRDGVKFGFLIDNNEMISLNNQTLDLAVMMLTCL